MDNELVGVPLASSRATLLVVLWPMPKFVKIDRIDINYSFDLGLK